MRIKGKTNLQTVLYTLCVCAFRELSFFNFFFYFSFILFFLFLTGRVDSERETERKVFLLPLVHPPMAAAVVRCGQRTALIRWQEPGASPGLPWGTGPKHLGHPPLHSLATAESWPGRRATGTRMRGAVAAGGGLTK